MLANVGGVFPTTTPEVGIHELVGSALLLAAAFVVVMSFRERRASLQSVLPAALIVFAVLFDVSVASNRLALGVLPSLAPRYTMANLLLLLAIIVYAIEHLEIPAAPALHSRSRPALVMVGALAVVIAIQLAVSTDNGLNSAQTFRNSMVLGDRLIVNRDQIPHGEEECYTFDGIGTYTGEFGDDPVRRPKRTV